MISSEFIDLYDTLDGVIGVSPHGGECGLEVSQALLFRTAEQRNKAYDILRNAGFEVAIILETAEVPKEYVK